MWHSCGGYRKAKWSKMAYFAAELQRAKNKRKPTLQHHRSFLCKNTHNIRKMRIFWKVANVGNFAKVVGRQNDQKWLILGLKFKVKYPVILAVMEAIFAVAYESLKNSGPQAGFQPVTSWNRCDALSDSALKFKVLKIKEKQLYNHITAVPHIKRLENTSNIKNDKNMKGSKVTILQRL